MKEWHRLKSRQFKKQPYDLPGCDSQAFHKNRRRALDLKIGIISLYRTLILDGNYGTLFQNWALQTYLNRRGHESSWIRTLYYKPMRTGGSRASLVLARGLLALNSVLVRFGLCKPRLTKSPHARPFKAFFFKHMQFSIDEYSADKLQRFPPRMDAFIVGSDQVWNSSSPIMYLEFVPRGARRIAYAASANWKKLSGVWLDKHRSSILAMDAVSVREQEGLAYCQKAGRLDTVQVLDPALLLLKDDYLGFIRAEGDNLQNERSFMFAYFVGMDDAHQATILKAKDVAEDAELLLHVDVLGQRENPVMTDNMSTVNVTPTLWLEFFNAACCIVTNSFHGTVFSILFERPFLIVLRDSAEHSGTDRMINLLAALNLQDRAITQSRFEQMDVAGVRSLMNSKIRWQDVNERLDKLRSISGAFLDSALGVEKMAVTA